MVTSLRSTKYSGMSKKTFGYHHIKKKNNFFYNLELDQWIEVRY